MGAFCSAMFFRPLLAYFSALLSSFFGIFQPTPPVGRENLIRRVLSDPLAVCNDGSNAAVYDSNDLADSTKLHIYLKGGGGCHSFEDGSEKNCVRSKTQTSSSDSHPIYRY